MKRLKHVGTEMSLHVLAYNMNRAIHLVGARQLISAIRP
jgi:transposase